MNVMSVFANLFVKFFSALFAIGPFLSFFAAICLCIELAKLMKELPKLIVYPICICCFLSVFMTSSYGYTLFHPSDEMIEEREEESASIEQAIEDAYNEGYSLGVEEASD